MSDVPTHSRSRSTWQNPPDMEPRGNLPYMSFISLSREVRAKLGVAWRIGEAMGLGPLYAIHRWRKGQYEKADADSPPPSPHRLNRFQFIAPQPLFLSPPFFPPNHAYLGRLALVLELGHRFYNRNFGDITSALGTSVYEDHPHHDTALTRERGVSAHALLVLTSVLPWAVEITVNSTSSFFFHIYNERHPRCP